MSILDQVTQMKSQGRSDSEIITSLQSQGIPPREIQDAMSQAQIKSAINSNTTGMEQSIMDQPYAEDSYAGQESYPAQIPTESYPAQSPAYSPQMPSPEYSQDYYQDNSQYYQDPNQGYAYPSSDTGTLVEISEQVFNDKARKIQKQLDSLNEFKTLSETRLRNVEERLKRIEEMFDKLQLAILDKIGVYGKNLSSLQKEVNMVQDSFSKVINPLVEKSGKRKR